MISLKLLPRSRIQGSTYGVFYGHRKESFTSRLYTVILSQFHHFPRKSNTGQQISHNLHERELLESMFQCAAYQLFKIYMTQYQLSSYWSAFQVSFDTGKNLAVPLVLTTLKEHFSGNANQDVVLPPMILNLWKSHSRQQRNRKANAFSSCEKPLIAERIECL